MAHAPQMLRMPWTPRMPQTTLNDALGGWLLKTRMMLAMVLAMATALVA